MSEKQLYIDAINGAGFGGDMHFISEMIEIGLAKDNSSNVRMSFSWVNSELEKLDLGRLIHLYKTIKGGI